MNIKKLAVGAFWANCYIFRKDKTVVIDPGDEVQRIVKELAGAQPEFIVLTHYHFDHVSAARELQKFSGAKILVHEKEKNFLTFVADHYLQDKEEINAGEINLKVVHTPGHTPGSICLLGENFLFSGDTLFANWAVGRTDFPGGSDEELKKSLEKLKRILKPGMRVYPGHGEDFIIPV